MLAHNQKFRSFAVPLSFVLAAVSLASAEPTLADSTATEEERIYHFCLKKEFPYTGRVFISALFASDAEEKEIRSEFAGYVSARYGLDEDDVSCSDGERDELQKELLSARKKFASRIVNTQWAAIAR